MEFLHRSRSFSVSVAGARIGILAGAFNPPTIAHLALAQAAADHVDEVVFVLPQSFPHKEYQAATLAERVEMLREITAKNSHFAVAVSEGGLFRDIAEEFRAFYGSGVRLSFLCGRDAAERLIHWNYGDGTTAAEVLRHFDLLVATRRGELETPLHLQHAIARLHIDSSVGSVSSSEVRERIARGEPWRHLVPESIHSRISDIYGK